MEQKPAKTYKREVAAAMLAYYFVMLTLGIWFPQAATAAASVQIPAFTFAGGAFALHAGAVQFQRRN